MSRSSARSRQRWMAASGAPPTRPRVGWSRVSIQPYVLSEEEWSAKSLRAREIKAAVHARKEALAAPGGKNEHLQDFTNCDGNWRQTLK